MTSPAEAVESLVALGLTEYQARCFVALTQLSVGTAKEVSQVADVPQSRVYDVTETLHERGLIDVKESEPRTYNAVAVEVAIDRLEQTYDDHLTAAGRRLDAIDSRETDPEGTWKIAGRRDVVDRMRTHVDAADEELYLVIGDAELLDETVRDALDGAVAADVDCFVEVPSERVRDRLHATVPDCQVAVTDCLRESVVVGERSPGRLLFVDREALVVSALAEGPVPGEISETGLWSEAGTGLVVWLRPLLVERLDRLEYASAAD